MAINLAKKRIIDLAIILAALFEKTKAQSLIQTPFDIIATLNGVQSILAHVGPILSAIMFIIAGIFFALAQLFPAYKRASLHATAADILVGAIIVAVLSVASNGLALASTHLLANITNSS